MLIKVAKSQIGGFQLAAHRCRSLEVFKQHDLAPKHVLLLLSFPAP